MSEEVCSYLSLSLRMGISVLLVRLSFPAPSRLCASSPLSTVSNNVIRILPRKSNDGLTLPRQSLRHSPYIKKLQHHGKPPPGEDHIQDQETRETSPKISQPRASKPLHESNPRGMLLHFRPHRLCRLQRLLLLRRHASRQHCLRRSRAFRPANFDAQATIL